MENTDWPLLGDFVGVQLAEILAQFVGTGDAETVEVGHTYYQFASNEDDEMLIEIASNQFLPADRQLTSSDEERLVGLGFTRPDDDLPNWWIGFDGADREQVLSAATRVVQGLVEVYGANWADVGGPLGILLPKVEPAGPTLLTPTEQEQFGDEEQYLLRAIERLDISPRPMGVTITEVQRDNPRLAALSHVAGAVELWCGANLHEGIGDEIDTWRAIQEWVGHTEWAGEYRFAILPDWPFRIVRGR